MLITGIQIGDRIQNQRIMYRFWLGWQGSNLRMTGSKPAALPLGDTPNFQVILVEFLNAVKLNVS